MKLRILPRAADDAQAAHDWYEAEQPGLGERFEQALGEALDRVEAHPRAHPKVAGDVRRALFRSFPYGVFYLLWPGDHDTERAIVLRIFHLNRHPDHWRQ